MLFLLLYTPYISLILATIHANLKPEVNDSYQTNEMFPYFTSTRRKEIIIAFIQSGDNALPLLKYCSDLNWTPFEVIDVLNGCVQQRLIRTFEYFCDNVAVRDYLWLTTELQKNILKSDLALLFIDLLPVEKLTLDEKFRFFMKALAYDHMDAVSNMIASDFLDFRRLNPVQLKELFFDIGLLGNLSLLEEILKHSGLKLSAGEHYHLCGAAKGGHAQEMVKAISRTSELIPNNVLYECLWESIRRSDMMTFDYIRRRSTLPITADNGFGLILAIKYASEKFFEMILQLGRGNWQFFNDTQSLIAFHLELHGDWDLLDVVKNLELDGKYNLPFALAARLGEYGKLLSLVNNKSIVSSTYDPNLHRPESLFKRFYPSWKFNDNYAHLEDQMYVSKFFDPKHVSISYQSHVTLPKLVEAERVNLLEAYYNHGIKIPSDLEANYLLVAIRQGKWSVFQFFLENFGIIGKIGDEIEVLDALINCSDTRFMMGLVEMWPTIVHQLFDMCIAQDKPAPLSAIIGGINNPNLLALHYSKVLQLFALEMDSTECLPIILETLPDSIDTNTCASLVLAISAGNYTFCKAYIETERLPLGSQHLRAAAASGDMKIFELIYTAYVKVRHCGFSKPFWLASKNGHLDIVRSLLTHDINEKYFRRSLRHSSRLERSDVLLLLLEANSKVNVPVEGLFIESIAFGSHPCYDLLMKRFVLSDFSQKMIISSIKSGSNIIFMDLISRVKDCPHPPEWWEVIVFECGKIGFKGQLLLLFEELNPFPFDILFNGYHNAGRILEMDALIKENRIGWNDRLMSPSFFLLGRLMKAIRLLDFSSICQTMREIKKEKLDLYRSVCKQFPVFIADNLSLIIQFAKAAPSIRASRKLWRVEALGYRRK